MVKGIHTGMIIVHLEKRFQRVRSKYTSCKNVAHTLKNSVIISFGLSISNRKIFFSLEGVFSNMLASSGFCSWDDSLFCYKVIAVCW